MVLRLIQLCCTRLIQLCYPHLSTATSACMLLETVQYAPVVGMMLSRFCNGLSWFMTHENLQCFFIEGIVKYETIVFNGSLGAWWFCLGWRKCFALNDGLGLKVQGEAIYDAFFQTNLKILLIIYCIFILFICTKNFFFLFIMIVCQISFDFWTLCVFYYYLFIKAIEKWQKVTLTSWVMVKITC